MAHANNGELKARMKESTGRHIITAFLCEEDSPSSWVVGGFFCRFTYERGCINEPDYIPELIATTPE